MKIRVELTHEPDGAWSAVCPELPGCASCGDTRDEALANIREAIALHLHPTHPPTPGAEQVFVAL
jgi:predicted RNase H-like HicB family nuclease